MERRREWVRETSSTPYSSFYLTVTASVRGDARGGHVAGRNVGLARGEVGGGDVRLSPSARTLLGHATQRGLRERAAGPRRRLGREPSCQPRLMPHLALGTPLTARLPPSAVELARLKLAT